MSKKIVTAFMIALMVIGVFVSILNFTATNADARMSSGDNGWDGALVYIFGENRYDCTTDWKIDCIIVTPKK